MIPPPPRSTLFPYTTLFRSLETNWNDLLERDTGSGGSLLNALIDQIAMRVVERLAGATNPLLVDQCIERSEEHTSELQSQSNLVCRLLLEKKKNVEKS